MKQVEIARLLGVSEATISKWEKVLEEDGPRGLDAQKASGRPPKLRKAQKEQLVEKLGQGALTAGHPTEQWAPARVKEVIEKALGLSYHRNYISRLLKGLGWSVQQPDLRAIERDEELIRAWLSQDWPRIKKAQRLGVEIVFVDEFGFSYTEPVSFTWAPKGQTPHIKRIQSIVERHRVLWR